MTDVSNAISTREKMVYGLGDLSSNLMWGLTSAYLMFYYTDIYGLKASSVGWILLIARIFDAFCDPVVGWFVDRQGGWVIPRLIRSLAVPLGMANIFCFLPLPFSPHGKILWAALSYIVFGAIYSCINTPYGALAPMMTVVSRDRVELNSFRMMGCQVGQFCIAALTIPAITWLGGGSSAAHRQKGMVLFVLFLSSAGVLLWRKVGTTCQARYPTDPVRNNIFFLLKILCRNRLWILCNVMVFQQFIVIAAVYGFVLYYVKCVLGGTDAWGGMALTLATVCSFLGAMLCPFSSRCFGVMKTAMIATLLQIAAYGAIFVSGGWIPSFVPAFSVLAFAQGLMSPLAYVFLATAIEDGSSWSSLKSTGLAYSINTLVSKVSMGVSGFVLALCLSYGHYDSSLLLYGEDTKYWINVGFVFFPISALLVQYIILNIWNSSRANEYSTNKTSS
ncbi:MFS transporter [Gluconobacter thailandicus]|uniref:MFS transporter n=1 Tax=Gluconobacter thailandicus TaxID=257438 RepID=A0AAP9ET79_GLUTH|nr:MFS transporter [Gluconobacter thailandicus]QEH96941.1 MFS transporter [Gluconobacter thailandicus]